MKIPIVYILTNKPKGTLYIGVTSNLQNRIEQHKEKRVGSFTKKYNLDTLVYYEQFSSMYDAISREKQLKNWQRQWKIALIEKRNPTWHDLSVVLF